MAWLSVCVCVWSKWRLKWRRVSEVSVWKKARRDGHWRQGAVKLDRAG